MSTPHSPADLEQLYHRRFEGMAAYRKAVWQILVQEFFAKWVPPSSVVLDLGCGHCEFINQVRAAQRFGMDLNPQARRSADQQVEILLQDCSTEWQLPSGALDVVFTSNFFEHLPTKAHLESTLAQAFRCLKPGGRLIALGPNIKYLPGAYWDFFDHYLPLTDLALQEVLEKVGFRVETRIPRFLPYSMSQGQAPPLWTLRLFLQARFLWPLVGKQFLLVAQRPPT